MARKIAVLLIVPIVIFWAAAVFFLVRADMITLIMCSAGEGGIRISASVCELHLKHFRDSPEDIAELSSGGLDPILNLESQKKYEIAAFLIANGLDVNAPNRLQDSADDVTPLHASVLYNDVERARFLLERGADSSVVSLKLGGVTALALAQRLSNSDPTKNRTDLIAVLSVTHESAENR